MITPLYVGIFGLWLAVLFLNVVRNRRKYKIAFGDGGVDSLVRARSIHENYVETVPFIIFIMFFMEALNYPAWLVHVFGVGMLVSRALHVIGIYKFIPKAPLRVLAGVSFITLLVAGSVLLLIKWAI